MCMRVHVHVRRDGRIGCKCCAGVALFQAPGTRVRVRKPLPLPHKAYLPSGALPADVSRAKRRPAYPNNLRPSVLTWARHAPLC